MKDNSIISKDVVERARRNSCVSDKIPIYGETYVSKKTKKRKEKNLEKGITTFLAISAAAVAILAGTSISSTMDFATEVRKEVNDTYVTQNLIGGQYIEKNEHDQEFRDYVSDLNDFQLSKIFNETSEQMQDSGMMVGISNIEDVVDQMEENYLETSGKSK